LGALQPQATIFFLRHKSHQRQQASWRLHLASSLRQHQRNPTLDLEVHAQHRQVICLEALYYQIKKQVVVVEKEAVVRLLLASRAQLASELRARHCVQQRAILSTPLPRHLQARYRLAPVRWPLLLSARPLVAQGAFHRPLPPSLEGLLEGGCPRSPI